MSGQVRFDRNRYLIHAVKKCVKAKGIWLYSVYFSRFMGYLAFQTTLAADNKLEGSHGTNAANLFNARFITNSVGADILHCMDYSEKENSQERYRSQEVRKKTLHNRSGFWHYWNSFFHPACLLGCRNNAPKGFILLGHLIFRLDCIAKNHLHNYKNYLFCFYFIFSFSRCVPCL